MTNAQQLHQAIETLFSDRPFQTRDLLFGAGSEARETVRRCIAAMAGVPLQRVDERVAGTVLHLHAFDIGVCKARVGVSRKKGWMLGQAPQPEPPTQEYDLTARVAELEARVAKLEKETSDA